VQVDLHELSPDQQELRRSLMNGYNFSENVRQSLAQARREAVDFHHEYVGTEHVLLGLLANPDNLAVALLSFRDVQPGAVRDRIASVVKRGTGREVGPDLPYTSRAKRILELAMGEARDLNASSVNTGHFFLGVIGEEKGIGASVLAQLGFTLDAARANLMDLTRAGHAEVRTSRGEMPAGPPSEMAPSHAAALLGAMTRSARVTAVFEKHGIDVQALIRDLLEDQPSP
jgi:ATP-dependent Clp protease ATP-binding subunit ClpA